MNVRETHQRPKLGQSTQYATPVVPWDSILVGLIVVLSIATIIVWGLVILSDSAPPVPSCDETPSVVCVQEGI